jgi:hypothetical protein
MVLHACPRYSQRAWQARGSEKPHEYSVSLASMRNIIDISKSCVHSQSRSRCAAQTPVSVPRSVSAANPKHASRPRRSCPYYQAFPNYRLACFRVRRLRPRPITENNKIQPVFYAILINLWYVIRWRVVHISLVFVLKLYKLAVNKSGSWLMLVRIDNNHDVARRIKK